MRQVIGIMLLTGGMLMAAGCTMDAGVPATPASSPSPIATDSAISSIVKTEQEDVTFADFIVPQSYHELRQLTDRDTNPDAVYTLREFVMKDSLSSFSRWLRNEADRLGCKVTERYGFEEGGRVELIIQLPSKTGTRIVSTYSPKYGDDQHLVVIETLFKQQTVFNPDTEDHALLIVTPEQGSIPKETFKGNYAHQHTDVYSVYYFSQAFFQQLADERYEWLAGKPDYTVGYFDQHGKEVASDQINENNREQVKFGIHLNDKFMPEDGHRYKELLSCWAKTVLIGNKADSGAHDASETLYFLENGRVFGVYKLQNLIADGA